ncbi:MAG: hypothetical protein U0350_11580 [Caldilineaceae bacterium]
MPKLCIYLFGAFQVTVDQQLVTGFRSNKARALLAYLLTQKGALVPRTELSALLWDGYTPEAAQTSLRSALLNLRQICAPFDLFEITRRTVRLKVDSAKLWCDVIAFQQFEQKQPLQERQAWLALASYVQRGFLTDFPRIDSAPFEQWRAVSYTVYRQQVEQLQNEVTDCLLPSQTTQATNQRLSASCPNAYRIPRSTRIGGRIASKSGLPGLAAAIRPAAYYR